MGAFRRTEVQIHVFFFFTVYRAFMCDGTNFLHFFSSNDGFHPENEGFFMIIGSIFDRGTSAQNTNVGGSFYSV